MPEMLVGVSEIQFEEFLRQGGQPAVVFRRPRHCKIVEA